jgi:hypothetical protein
MLTRAAATSPHPFHLPIRRLWVSYYSTHEGKTAIYLARVKIPPAK